MTEITRTALIVGSTGLVGDFLLHELMACPLFTRVIAVSRSPISIDNEKLVNIVTDFKDLDVDLKGIYADNIFCCLGTTIKKAGHKEGFRHVDFDLPVQIAHLMHRAGAKHFSVISALGADASSRIFYNQVKGQLEESVLAIGYDYTSIFRPSLLLGERHEKRLGESFSIKASALVSPLMIGPLKSIRPVPAQAVARSMLNDALAVAREQRPKGNLIIDSKQIFEAH